MRVYRDEVTGYVPQPSRLLVGDTGQVVLAKRTRPPSGVKETVDSYVHDIGECCAEASDSVSGQLYRQSL